MQLDLAKMLADDSRKDQLQQMKLRVEREKANQALQFKARDQRLKEADKMEIPASIPPLGVESPEYTGIPPLKDEAPSAPQMGGMGGAPTNPEAGPTDTVPAMLSPGEAVIPAQAAQDPRNKPAIAQMVNEGRGYASGTKSVAERMVNGWNHWRNKKDEEIPPVAAAPSQQRSSSEVVLQKGNAPTNAGYKPRHMYDVKMEDDERKALGYAGGTASVRGYASGDVYIDDEYEKDQERIRLIKANMNGAKMWSEQAKLVGDTVGSAVQDMGATFGNAMGIPAISAALGVRDQSKGNYKQSEGLPTTTRLSQAEAEWRDSTGRPQPPAQPSNYDQSGRLSAMHPAPAAQPGAGAGPGRSPVGRANYDQGDRLSAMHPAPAAAPLADRSTENLLGARPADTGVGGAAQLTDDTLNRMGFSETGMTPDVKNKYGNAGKFQWSPDTYERLQKKFPGKYTAKFASPEFYKNDYQMKLGREIMEDDLGALDKMGLRPNTDGGMYSVLHMGRGDAIKLFKASDDTPLDKIWSAGVIKKNPQFQDGKTVADAKAWFEQRMNPDKAQQPTVRDPNTATEGARDNVTEGGVPPLASKMGGDIPPDPNEMNQFHNSNDKDRQISTLTEFHQKGIETAHQQAAALPPAEQKGFLARAIESLFGDSGLFTPEALTRFALIAAGGMLTGGSVAGSFKFAARDTLQNFDSARKTEAAAKKAELAEAHRDARLTATTEAAARRSEANAIAAARRGEANAIAAEGRREANTIAAEKRAEGRAAAALNLAQFKDDLKDGKLVYTGTSSEVTLPAGAPGDMAGQVFTTRTYRDGRDNHMETITYKGKEMPRVEFEKMYGNTVPWGANTSTEGIAKTRREIGDRLAQQGRVVIERLPKDKQTGVRIGEENLPSNPANDTIRYLTKIGAPVSDPKFADQMESINTIAWDAVMRDHKNDPTMKISSMVPYFETARIKLLAGNLNETLFRTIEGKQVPTGKVAEMYQMMRSKYAKDGETKAVTDERVAKAMHDFAALWSDPNRNQEKFQKYRRDSKGSSAFMRYVEDTVGQLKAK
jgi:hypothetical protein